MKYIPSYLKQNYKNQTLEVTILCEKQITIKLSIL